MKIIAALLLTLALAACAPSASREPGEPAAVTTPAPTSAPTEATTSAPPKNPSTPDPASASTSGAAHKVRIVEFTFDPSEIRVAVGDTVAWHQADASRHTVDFTDGTESGPLEEGDTYTRTFEEAGEYPYVCFFHPRMTATVVVEG